MGYMSQKHVKPPRVRSDERMSNGFKSPDLSKVHRRTGFDDELTHSQIYEQFMDDSRDMSFSSPHV